MSQRPLQFALTAVFLTGLAALWLVALPVQSTQAQQKKGKGGSPLDDVKVPPGYKAKVFAAPPDVNYPTCLACAPTGEVFVGVDQNSSLDAKPDRGKILRLVDTTGSGKADKITVFTKLDSPRGLIYDNKTLYVLHPPFLTAFYDDDGDGVADRSKVLVKGIGRDLKFRGADHTTNGIRMGIDGWIYVAVGDYGFPSAVGTDGKSLEFRGGGIVRVRPDGTELEAVVRGTRNIYDVAIDPLMNLFTRDNTNDGDLWDVRLNHDTPMAIFGYPSLFMYFGDEIIQPLADYGGGAPTGAMFLDEPGFSPEVGYSLLTCDWGRSNVYRHPLKSDGASFTIEQKPFVQLSRPTGIAVDGESRLYIASWRGAQYNYIGPDIGYIVQVTYPEKKVEPFPDLGKASEADLVKYMASPSHSRRLCTQSEILRRGIKRTLIDGLEKLAKEPGPLPVRVAAIFTYEQLAGLFSVNFLTTLAKDDSVREFALHALADRKSDAVELPVDIFQKALGDPNPRVRLQAAIGLARIGKKEAAPGLIGLTADKDPVISHTAIQALVQLHAEEACLAELDKPNTIHALACARVLQNFHDKTVVEGLLERFAKVSDVNRRSAIFRALCRLYYREAGWDGKSWWGTRPDTSGPYFKPVQWSESQRIGDVLKSTLASADKDTMHYVLPELVRHKIDLPDLTKRLMTAAQTDPEFRPQAAMLLIRRGKIAKEAVPLLEQAATWPNADPLVRAKMLRGLWKNGPGDDGLNAVLRSLGAMAEQSDMPPAIAEVFSEFTTDFGNAKKLPIITKAADASDAGQRAVAYQVLLNLRANKNATKQIKDSVDDIVDRALSNPDRAIGMLKAIGATRTEDYGVRVQGLTKSDRPTIQAAAAATVKLLGLDRPPVDRKDTIAALKYEDVLAKAADEKGDATLGSRLFLKQNCIACHTVSKSEPVKGPYLGDVAARYKRPELIESILKPNAKIAQGFETHVFTLVDGKTLTGFVIREAGDQVEIRDGAGLTTVLKRDDIDVRRQTPLSVMPDGLADNLTVQELASILAYLESLSAK